MVLAVPVPSGFPIAVDTFGTAESQSSVVALDNGRMLVVWAGGELASSATRDIYARIFAAYGQPEGDAFAVNDDQISRQSSPRVAVLSDGSFVIGWDSSAQFPMPDKPYGIYDTAVFHHFDAQGRSLGGDQPAPLQPVMGRPLLDVHALADGGFAVSYYIRGNTLAAQFYDAAGQPLGGQVVLTAPPPVPNTSQLPTGYMDLAGGRLLAWTPYVPAAGFDPDSGIGNAVVFQVFGSDGTLIRRTICKGMETFDIKPLANGGFVVNWGPPVKAQFDNIGGGIQVFDANARPVSDRIIPDIGGSDAQVIEPVVLADGRIAVLSRSFDPQTRSVDTYLSIHDATGQELTAPVRLAGFDRSNQEFTEFLALPNGGLLWLTYADSTTFGRVISAEGVVSDRVVAFGPL